MLSSSNSLRSARPYLGTLVEITLEAEQGHDLQIALNAAYRAIARIQQLMSFHDPDSDVSRINCAPAGLALTVDLATYEVLQCAQALSLHSHGLFDITVADILIGQGFLPSSTGVPRDHAARSRDLELLADHQVKWHRAGRIDLGGIAKGYAVDCAIAVLQQYGISHAMINAGGDLRCIGQPQRIHLRVPHDPQQLLALGWLHEGALATSAGYYTQRADAANHAIHPLSADPQRQGAHALINPIVDPRLQRCIAWQGSISVVAERCMIADALTKVVRLLADEAADGLADANQLHLPQILAHFDAQALMLDQRGLASLGSSERLHF